MSVYKVICVILVTLGFCTRGNSQIVTAAQPPDHLASFTSSAAKLLDVLANESPPVPKDLVSGAKVIVIANDGQLFKPGTTWLKLTVESAGKAKEVFIPPLSYGVIFYSTSTLEMKVRFCPSGGFFGDKADSPGVACNYHKTLWPESSIQIKELEGINPRIFGSKKGNWNYWWGFSPLTLEEYAGWFSRKDLLPEQQITVVVLDRVDSKALYVRTREALELDRRITALNIEARQKKEKLDSTIAYSDSVLTELSELVRERERIEREGDGSEDDLACKARRLKPSTDSYKKCRDSIVATRETRARQEKLLEEKRNQEQAERESKVRLAAERKHQQEQAAREAKEQRERFLAEKYYREKAERERRELMAAEEERERQEERERRREEAAAKDPYFYVKEQCRELGFKDKTEKFGTCVLELSKRGGDQQTRSESRTVRGDGTPDDATCVGYGYSVGSSGYADCRMKLDQARRDYERELRAYQAEKAAYDQRVAEGQAEARRRQQEKQAQYGFCVAACSSQPGSTALGCMSRCGAASAGLPFDPGAPPARPSGRTTYVINGRIINCNTSPSGSIVTCN